MEEISLFDYIDQPLTNNRIKMFNRKLIDSHIGNTHPIYTISSKYTLLDALKYIFEHDAVAIANVLQSYDLGQEHSLMLIHALEDGIKTKSICLTCIHNNVHSIINHS